VSTKLTHNLCTQTLDIGIEVEWLMPEAVEAEFTFSKSDIAHVQLIWDLTDELGVNSEDVGVILHSLDQTHGLRSPLLDLVDTARSKNENYL
jgi:chaperone modulatory protein CbpM